MGIFGNRNTDNPEDRPLVPIVVDEAEVQRASVLLAEVEAAVASDDVNMAGLLQAIGNFSRAAGTLSLGEIFALEQNSKEVHRTWRWLSEVGRCAPTVGENNLVGRIFQFTLYWRNSIQPQLLNGDFMDMRLEPIPDEYMIQISENALNAFRDIPPETVVIEMPTVVVTADAIIRQARPLVADPNYYWHNHA